MTNSPRKILSSQDCYMCYSCPPHCYISPPPPPFLPDPVIRKRHVSTVLILMLCFLGIIFLFLSYLTIVRKRLRNSRTRTPHISMADYLDENQGRSPVFDHHVWYIRTVGLPQSVIDSIRSFPFKKRDPLIECNQCSICLSEFQEDEVLRMLPNCRHAFHANCIDIWLRSHKNCPVCRTLILINESSSSCSQVPAETEEPRPVQEDVVDYRERRSVSVDFSLAAVVEEGGEGCSAVVAKKDCKFYRLMRSASCVQDSLRKGPVCMKRSFTFSGKRSGRRISRSLEVIQY